MEMELIFVAIRRLRHGEVEETGAAEETGGLDGGHASQGRGRAGRCRAVEGNGLGPDQDLDGSGNALGGGNGPKRGGDVTIGGTTLPLPRNVGSIGLLEEYRFFIREEATTNGTQVNENRISTARPLEIRDGDEITFGAVRMRLIVE